MIILLCDIKMARVHLGVRMIIQSESLAGHENINNTLTMFQRFYLNSHTIYWGLGDWCKTSDISNSVKKADYR